MTMFLINDNGTISTIVAVNGTKTRYAKAYVARYRDTTGALDFGRFIQDHWPELRKAYYAE